MAMRYEKSIRIPRDRIGVLIGSNGSVIRELENRTGTRIEIERGLVRVLGEAERIGDVYKAIDVIRAIGRGFSPVKAFKLLEDGYELRVISLREYAHTKNRKRIIRGRLIGRSGRARETIEKMTNTFISIYGDTVSIIGKVPDIDIAEDAILRLILGRKHTTVFRLLQETISSLEDIDKLSPGGYKFADIESSVEKAIEDIEKDRS